MPISVEDVRHFARLSRLELSAEEAEKLRGELEAMLEYFGQIAAIDTEGIPPTSHPVEIHGALREDVPREVGSGPDLLRLAPDAHPPFYRVPRFHQG
ncbi:MAG: Asp-tRNA(Asn)/Glu-tRNA(Gln) amidotransferase subunit GatC [Acidobacteriota bacterium]